MSNKLQLCRIIYYSLPALHVSRDIFAHYREHLNTNTRSCNKNGELLIMPANSRWDLIQGYKG